VRLPQVRYTQPLAPWGIPGALSASIEVPETDFWKPATGLTNSDSAAGFPTKNSAPDLTAAWYIPQPWGHLDYAAVVRPSMQYKDGNAVDKTFTGFGFAMGGDVKPQWFGWDRDYIVFRAVGGWGIGRYVNSSASIATVTNFPNATTPVTPAQAALVTVKPVTTFGGDVGYQHRWSPTLRSNISGGFWHQDVPTSLFAISATGTNTGVSAVCSNVPAGAAGTPAQNGVGGCAINKEIITGHLNLIWNPVSFLDIGIEYIYGHRMTVSNLKGDEHALVSRFQINF
ncbi:MAG TPA: DcaP family trimeric outer membrane transporter, partial [Stellaceae bacterium]|nr:DcaP family trimeric outer membrane transporter [Stellaceae bacterium]